MSTFVGHGESKPVSRVGDNIARSNIVPKGSWGAGTPFGPFLLHQRCVKGIYCDLNLFEFYMIIQDGSKFIPFPASSSPSVYSVSYLSFFLLCLYASSIPFLLG